MDFELSDVHAAWREKGATLGQSAADEPSATAIVVAAARTDLLDPAAELLSVACAVEAAARESSSAGLTLALHAGVVHALGADARFSALCRGEVVAAVALSSDDVPVEENGRLTGRCSWVAPLTPNGLAVVGPRADGDRLARVVRLDDPAVILENVPTSGLHGLLCGHLVLQGAQSEAAGPTVPIMARVRTLIAAASVGIGDRALQEALAVARVPQRGAGGEQTVQGLLADSATELDAARLMTWRAATATPLSLADASLAKLMATAAAQRAVENATQVVGAGSFQQGHVLARLAQDVRALELFAGRTEALRAAVSQDRLPPVPLI